MIDPVKIALASVQKDRQIERLATRVRELTAKLSALNSRYQQLAAELTSSQREAGELQRLNRGLCADRIEDTLDNILANYATIADQDAARLVARLARQRRHLFTFLYHDAVPPTNNHAERMIRAEVVARKTQGCNKSTDGADAHAILGSILVTEKQRGRSPVNRLAQLVRQRAGPT